MQCPRCQQANPPLAKFCLECGMPFKPLDESVQSGPLYAELQRALSESRAQQAATAEILDAISRSPTELQPILDAVAQNASRLCGAANVSLYRVEGNQMRKVAEQGRPLTALRVDETRPITRTTVSGRAIVDRTTIHLPDHQSAQAVQEYPDARRDTGIRTTIGIPLLREGVAIGVFTAYRTESRPFAEREITLLQTFANQAAIAIENVRLFNETKEALEQQTATTEILSVISSSPTDAQPVFEAIVRSAVRVCNARFANVFRLENDVVHLAAHHNVPFEALEHFRHTFPQPLSQGGTLTAQAMRHGTVVHIHDVEAQSDVSAPVRALTRSAGYRTVLAVPILRPGNVVGAIGVGRSDVTGAPWPFSDKEVALLRTFADQAVIAIENVRLFTELQEKNRALTQAHAQVTEALDRQTATSEILRVISSSPTDAQPVFEAIARNAARLCDASRSSVNLLEGDWIRFVAQYNLPEGWTQIHVSDAPNATRVIRDGVIFHVADAQTDDRVTPEALSRVRALGARSFLMVPLHREMMPIGSIVVYRSETGSFSDQQVELLQTFADQAVIAIENVRLFKELEGRNAELTQALDQQIATGEILRVISRSPTNVQPVFDTIVRNAVRLCGALHGGVYTFDGELVHARANEGYTPEQLEHWRSTFPRPVTSGSVVAKAIRSNSVVLIDDLETAPAFEVSRETLANLRVRGSRSLLTVPMTRHDEVIGAIGLAHGRVGAFSETHVELLKTFADQAVIAIENVRLFTELQEKNRALTTAHAQVSEALDQQTATSEILRVISQSPTDVQPVFDAIVQSAVRLLRAHTGALTRIVGDQIELAALTSSDNAGGAAVRSVFPQSLQSVSPYAWAIRDRATVNVADVETDPGLPERARAAAHARGFRSWVVVPMFRHAEAVGTISVTRREPGGFTDDEIALLNTFADQAVIAIQNARLLGELQSRTFELTRSVDELTALGEVSRALSSTLDVDVVLDTIVTRANDLIGADGCTIFEYDEAAEQFHLRATRHLEPRLVELARGTPLRRGDQGILGRLPSERQPVQVPDITVGSYSSPISAALIEAGYRAVVAVPLIREDHLIGALTMNRKTPGEFPPETIHLLQTFATQSALAIQNARLFREIEDKSRQLEVASQHKSEFLANMSHELRTPLNAIIGFSEVLTDRMFGELNEKQEEYLKDIYASGTHLLSLINDILDLSKIEAGRMELELTDFDLPQALDNAVMLVRERAGRRSITLQMSVDERLGEVQADERKIRQVVLNLLSNAIKFTPEGGRIEVAAVPTDGFVEVAVTDTGIGIAPKDQEAVFEEFRQVGTAEKKAEGTGLGLTLCRKFIELHGGRIWVRSEVGLGSTFTFSIPVGRGD